MRSFFTRLPGFRLLALVCAPLAAAACDDAPTRANREAAVPTVVIARLECAADVASGAVECAAPGGAAPAAPIPGPGPRFDQRTVGGQGVYVRMASSGAAYDAGTQVFSFNATVQNLSNLPMATATGAARHDGGIRVFLIAPPSGSGGIVTVANPTGTAEFTAPGQAYYQYGGSIGGTDQGELGADGILASGEASAAKQWQFNMGGATSFTFSVYVATEMPSGALATVAPQVTSVSPATLVPGASATITGINFNATPGSNAVSIGGRAATVTGGAGGTSLTVTVPCTASGSVPVTVTQGGMTGRSLTHPLQVTQRTVGVGQALVLSSSTDSHCNELTATGAASRYVVTVFSVSSSPTSNTPFQFSADGGLAAPVQLQAEPVAEQPLRPGVSLQQGMEAARQRAADERHHWLLEQNRVEYERLRGRFGAGAGGTRTGRVNRNVVMGDPPLTRTFRVANIAAAGFCNSFYVVSATRVYSNGKIAIYEDDATPDAFKSSLNPTMAANYQKIGDQFNADMEPIVRTNFGDILRRDAVTDNNGILIALFTPRINTSFTGVAGFVVSCDQYPNDDASTPAVGGPYTGTASSGSSNFGEYFYAYQPVTPGTGYSGNTAENWYRTIRSTFIHESKHVASMSARVANGAPLEAGFLEEGTARHSEELWMRNAVDNVAWKANTGYGSAANPINVYCDVRVPPSWPECSANTRRPASIMQRHFTSLNNHLVAQNARFYSPFGPSQDDTGSNYYAISWSLVRYAIDRYGASDAAFLTALTNSTTTGVTNLSGRAGVSIDQLLGGWGLTLYADDHPALGVPSTDLQFPTWNLRSIYAGLNADLPSTYTTPFPLVPTPLSFGGVATLSTLTLRGGGTRYYEFTGTQTAAQLLRLEANGGGAPSSNLRIAVARLQ
ncbi:MAG TPA: IPT/TIG domain-containing protein [Longimicrobium sp.]|jgi:hypothetical protein|uniref:IPT/TIG domain-containing protein n=1 Tax=Longimicrobium sp. TaxID=2029185 RepID=UPI002ED924CA